MSPPAKKDARPPRSRLRRVLRICAIVLPIALIALWIAIHRIVWLGPLLADTARSIVGPGPVAWLENVAYSIDDRVQQIRHGGDRPEAYWTVPPPTAAAPSAAPSQPASPPTPTGGDPSAAPAAPRAISEFRPADVPPVFKDWSAEGDGVWIPIPDPRRLGDPPRLYKTLLHPDRNRSWATLAVVAVDLRAVALHPVAGLREPESVEKGSEQYTRTGIIHPDHHRSLLAAFNGGFKTIHGRYGMKIDGVTLLKPRKDACTIARAEDGALLIRSWKVIADKEDTFKFWRQTPGCLVEQGQMHAGLAVESNTYWGSKIGGDTVIRRSAIGISADGRTLFVGIGDFTTATSIAKGMSHAGAYDVAELDVNWSFPKFVLYEPRPGAGSAAELIAVPISKGFEWTEDDYIRDPSPRDFFYLTRIEPGT